MYKNFFFIFIKLNFPLSTTWLPTKTNIFWFFFSFWFLKTNALIENNLQILKTIKIFLFLTKKHFGTFLFQKERLMFLLPLQNVVITWHLLYSKVKKIRRTIDVKKNHFFSMNLLTTSYLTKTKFIIGHRIWGHYL